MTTARPFAVNTQADIALVFFNPTWGNLRAAVDLAYLLGVSDDEEVDVETNQNASALSINMSMTHDELNSRLATRQEGK